MTGPDDQLELRRKIGFYLRFPAVAFLALLWLTCFWWWLAAIGIAIEVAMLIARPLAYPLLYVLDYLRLAFFNSKDPVLPNYFEDYPDEHIEGCWRLIKLGFPTLKRGLLEGF